MALLGAYHVGTGAAVQLSTLVPSVVKEIDIRANPGNSAIVYLGGADVAADGSNAWICLDAGDPWGKNADQMDQINLHPDDVYLIATASDQVHISYVI